MASHEPGAMGTNDTRSPALAGDGVPRLFWAAAASVAVASASYAFAWDGGLWAALIWVPLAVVTWRRARRARPSVWAKRSALLSALAVVTGVYAFASSGGLQPALRSDSASYTPGEEVRVQLRAGIRPLGYNLCFTTLERRGPDGWHRMPEDDRFGEDGSVSACPAIQYGLSPLFGARGSVHLPPDLPAGEYRLVHGVEVGGERRDVATKPFAVTG